MGCKPIRLTSAVLLGLVFRCQWGKHEGFVKYFLRLRSNGKEKRVIFFNFRQPPNTLHIHSSDRERTWPEAHCHVCDCRAFSTMLLCSNRSTFSTQHVAIHLFTCFIVLTQTRSVDTLPTHFTFLEYCTCNFSQDRLLRETTWKCSTSNWISAAWLTYSFYSSVQRGVSPLVGSTPAHACVTPGWDSLSHS